MEILEKITQLRMSRNWSEYQLAEKSGLSQSTISSWYHKNLLPSIPSLQCICNAFGISLSQFFLDEGDSTVLLNEQQIRLIQASARLTPAQLSALLHFLETL